MRQLVSRAAPICRPSKQVLTGLLALLEGACLIRLIARADGPPALKIRDRVAAGCRCDGEMLHAETNGRCDGEMFTPNECGSCSSELRKLIRPRQLEVAE
jgi:hypothetical protein